MEEHRQIEKIIWDELVQAKSMEQYISNYIGSRIDWNKRFSIITLSLSVIGAGTWGVWKLLENFLSFIPLILFVLIGLAQVLSAIQNKITIDEETLKSLSKLRSLYIEYFNKLEQLFLNAYDNTLTEKELETIFFSLRETVSPMEELKDSLNIDFTIKKVRKAQERNVKMYLEDRWGVNFEES